MGTIKNFEELGIWKLSRELVNLIYSDFRLCRDFTFRNQITGAGISIMNNISEGFFRNSDSEFRQFLNIAKGSAGEVKSMYYIAEDQNYVSNELALDRRSRCQLIMAGTSNLMKYLKSTKNPRPPDPQTPRPPDPQTLRPSDPQTLRLSDFQFISYSRLARMNGPTPLGSLSRITSPI